MNKDKILDWFPTHEDKDLGTKILLIKIKKPSEIVAVYQDGSVTHSTKKELKEYYDFTPIEEKKPTPLPQAMREAAELAIDQARSELGDIPVDAWIKGLKQICMVVGSKRKINGFQVLSEAKKVLAERAGKSRM